MLRLTARGKINWSLDITGKREDGYHLMDMLMQNVDLADELTLAPAREVRLACEGVRAGEKNLVLRAARVLQTLTGCRMGADMTLRKRVPIGAGMGGGSADAAAALIGLNELWGLRLTEEELLAVGLRLGADVPFLLTGGLARVSGVGEQLRSLPEAPAIPLVVVQPCGGLSTPEIFKAFDEAGECAHPDTDGAQDALRRGELTRLAECAGNVLQPISEAKRPQIAQAVQALRQSGARCALMTGSGSAVFGAFASREEAQKAADGMSERWPKTWVCASCRESVTFEDGE
ncbi:MAG: 4-(cytidine 5'-diphospho)-2-C-methyl-D-erythritol kinase [Eubacteriales bacterium]|nr:4-(cytidine 5'-diphospho)-2-C-methyl-D-erythritol kinase [Eubacteriales bacterium]